MVVTAQRPAAGGETRVEAGSWAAQTGAAQGGGDGTTTTLWPGDGAPQEAAEAARGQEHWKSLIAYLLVCVTLLDVQTMVQHKEEPIFELEEDMRVGSI